MERLRSAPASEKSWVAWNGKLYNSNYAPFPLCKDRQYLEPYLSFIGLRTKSNSKEICLQPEYCRGVQAKQWKCQYWYISIYFTCSVYHISVLSVNKYLSDSILVYEQILYSSPNHFWVKHIFISLSVSFIGVHTGCVLI